MLFDPVRLIDGIDLSYDPLPLAGSAVYAISYDLRNKRLLISNKKHGIRRCR